MKLKTNKNVESKQSKPKPKGKKFTYVGKQTKYITKVFKNSNLRIAYKTNNTTERLLNVRHGNNTNKFNKFTLM